MKLTLTTPRSQYTQRLTDRLLALHKAASDQLMTATDPVTWHQAQARLTALEDALDAVRECK